MTGILVRAWHALDRGRLAECARLLASAPATLSGVDLARADCLAGLSSCVAGEHELAVARLTAVLPRLDERWAANALVGRGTAYGYLTRPAEAESDFTAAAGIYRSAGEHRRVSACVHNRGFVALRVGDVASALRLFDEAGLEPKRFPEALVDRASALVAAGLVADARPLLARASTLLAGRGAKLAEATLALAHCALRSGRPEIAATTAARAAAMFGRQGRTSWRAAARAVELTARGGPVPVLRRVADECDRYGWTVLAAELRLSSGDRSLWSDAAKGRLAEPAAVRAVGWLARAKLADDRRAVSAACRAGLVAARRDASAGAYAVALANVGLRAALTGGRPRSVLRWADRTVNRSVESADSGALAMRLAALRSATVTGSSGRVRRLERQVRALDASSARIGVDRAWTLGELFDALGDAELVQFVAHDGRLRAVSCVDGRVDGRDLVVVPAPGMWAELPVWPGRAVTVTPSIGAWLRATRADVPGAGLAWLAGPGLRHAAPEARSLHARYGGQLRVGRAATARAALTAMDGADVVHIAAHGRFRADAPMLSSVELSGGPLFGYDVRSLRRAPRRVVLAACESGRAAVRQGAAIGLALAFLRAGAATVIASTRTVPDRETMRLVTALHDGLAEGLRPASALADAQAEHGHLGFICLGAG